jgi:uncharacterized protein YdhG (YjbR/CyaY superfamily)
MAQKFETVDEYVAAQPAPSRRILDEVRRRVGVAVPSAVEAISYQIPTFKVDGKAVLYVAAWKEHIAVYPIPDTDPQLTTEIERYRSGKGTLRFPLDEPFPFELVDRLVTAAVDQWAPA